MSMTNDLLQVIHQHAPTLPRRVTMSQPAWTVLGEEIPAISTQTRRFHLSGAIPFGPVCVIVAPDQQPDFIAHYGGKDH